jgi:toxin ParE1/3/4
MARYRITKKAAIDLANIWSYTVDNWSETQADSYYRMLLDNCQDICDRKAPGRQYDGIYADLLGHKAGKHIIFYQEINPGVVDIIRILHERMDLKRRIID